MEIHHLITASLNLALMILMSNLESGLQAPTQPPQEGSGSNDTLITTDDFVAPLTSCPGYERGNPSERNKTGCKTGTYLDSVDHDLAFGFSSGGNPDWNACHLPVLPEANHKVCYRTTVDKCGNDYRVYLNLRNLTRVQRTCPNEREILPTTQSDGSDRLLQSPRYGCRKGKGTGSLYEYRRSDLCLYNISIPNCESGFVRIQSFSGGDHEIERRRRDTGGLVCNDYLQFFYGGLRTERFCGTDLTLKLPLLIPATQIMAVFWTDPVVNEPGFNLRVSCRPLTGI